MTAAFGATPTYWLLAAGYWLRLIIDSLAQIPLGHVGHERNDALAFAEPLRDLNGRPDVAACGDAGEHALLPSEAARHVERDLVVRRDHFAAERAVEVFGHEARADPLHPVRRPRAAAIDRPLAL